MLMSVPNVSEGSDRTVLRAIAEAFSPAQVLDVHSDSDHQRSVFTLAAEQGKLAAALASGASAAFSGIDLRQHAGVHPHVGVVDVVPVVYLTPECRGAACAEALLAAQLIASSDSVPVFLYGELAGGRERAELRSGGTEGLAQRIARGEQKPDFGPSVINPRSGATLIAARPPMVAFNLVLAEGETIETAKAIAARLRESGGGPIGVRAIGLWLDERARAQVSCNVHDPFSVPLREIVSFVRQSASVEVAELIGLAPATAFKDFPPDVEIEQFDPAKHVIENALELDVEIGARQIS